MKRNSTLSIFAAICLIATLASTPAFSQTTYTNNGTNTSYNLGNGDSLYIRSGTYTGSISAFNTGAKITVAEGASFQPSSFSNPKGLLTNYGTFKFTSELKGNTGFTISNYGTMWVTENIELNGTDEVWTNQYGGTMRFDKAVSVNGNNKIVNKGTTTIGTSLSLNATSSLNNRNNLTVTGSFAQNTGTTFLNEAKFEANTITFNSGATVNNICRLVATTSLTNNSNSVSNSGLIWVKSNAANLLTNSGTINSTNTGKVKAVNFTNWGTLSGTGYYYFTGTTINSGTTGVTGNTTDSIRIYDVTRTNPTTIFDTQWGNVRPNTIYSAFAAPDTVNNFAGCSSEATSAIALPVKWNYFFVNLSNGTPSINWSATQDAGTTFEIERSYSGSEFAKINAVAATTDNKADYSIADNNVNTQAAIVYYRIKAVEPNGTIKYSETKAVKFSNKNGVTIQAVPNPFASQFTINYQSNERTTITIQVYGLNGQLQFAKTATVANGYNSITVTEAASLAKGMYMVQITKGAERIATERMIKQ